MVKQYGFRGKSVKYREGRKNMKNASFQARISKWNRIYVPRLGQDILKERGFKLRQIVRVIVEEEKEE